MLGTSRRSMMVLACLAAGITCGAIVGNLASENAQAVVAYPAIFKSCGKASWYFKDPYNGHSRFVYPTKATINVNCKGARRLLGRAASWLSYHRKSRVRMSGYVCSYASGRSNGIGGYVYMRCSRREKIADMANPLGGGGWLRHGS